MYVNKWRYMPLSDERLAWQVSTVDKWRHLLINSCHITTTDVPRGRPTIVLQQRTTWRVYVWQLQKYMDIKLTNKGKGKGRYSSCWGEPHLTAMGCHLPYGITQCYLPPNTSERTLPNPSHAGLGLGGACLLPRRDGRLSWASWLDSAPAGSQTSKLTITSPTPNHCTTKTAKE